MSDKPELKLIEAAASDDPFDLERLRLNPEMLEAASVKKLLTTVPVRKPLAQDFVRVRPEPHYRATLAFIELKDDRETYIVDLGAVPELAGECLFANLFTAITRTGVVFMWPVKIPAADGRISEWNVSAATAAQHAQGKDAQTDPLIGGCRSCSTYGEYCGFRGKPKQVGRFA